MKLTADGFVQTNLVDGTTLTGLFNEDGSLNIVLVDGTSVTGLYHACGAYNVVQVDGLTPCGAYAPCGALNVIVGISGTTGRGPRHASGAFLISSALSNAFALLSGEDEGLAFDFTDNSAYIVDTGTPANDYNSTGIVSSGELVGPSGKLTYTSPSNKLTLQSDGYYKYQAHNLCPQSEDIVTGTSGWTKNGGSAVSVSQFTEDTSTGEHRFYSAAFTTVTGGTYTFACEVSVSDTASRFVCLRFVSTGVQAETYFNLGAGAISSTTSGSATITDVGGGVYRCTVTGVAGGTTGQAYLNLSTTGNAKSYTGDGVQTLTATKMHVYRYPANTDYIRTASSAVYALPLEYSATDGSCLGLLVEEARTNLMQYSQALSNFSSLNITETDNNAVSPSGLTDACTLTAAGATTSLKITYTAKTLTASTNYAFSIYAKQGTHPYVALNLQGTTAEHFACAVFDLSSGGTTATETDVGTSSGTIASTSMEDVGNGWYRCTLVSQIGITAANVWVGLPDKATGNNFNSSGQVTWASPSVGTESVHVWGWQLELGSFPTSPILTYGSALARAADNISIATSAFPFNQAASTFYVHVDGTSTAEAANTRYAQLSAGLGERYIEIYHNGGVPLTYAGNGTLFVASAESRNQSDLKVVVAMAANDGILCANGTLTAQDTSVTVTQNPTGIQLGRQNTINYINGYIKAIAYWPRRRADSELQTVTA